MATFAKVQDFVEQLGLGTHNLGADTLKLALVTSTHVPGASDTAYSDVSANEVANGVGYTTGGATLATVAWTESAGTAKLDADNPSWTASGGSITYRYAYLYNDTAVGKNLIAYWDEGADVTIADGETRTLQVNASGILTVA